MEPATVKEQLEQMPAIPFQLTAVEAIHILMLASLGTAVMTQDREAFEQIAQRLEGPETGERAIAAVKRMSDTLRVAVGAEPEGEAG